MVDLAEKYRPRRLQDIVGQPRLVTWMKGQIRSRERRSVLIEGPFGTGKTSAGLIYARAILCTRPDDGEPCGACDSCLGFGGRGERLPDVTLFKCGETSTVEKIQELLEVARSAPFVADRRVLLLDEAHNLSRRSSQALLDIVENPPQWAVFILMTSETNELPSALLSRLTRQPLELVSQPDALMFMADICKREGIAFDIVGLELIFGVTRGHPRKLLRELEMVRGFGAITAPTVRSALRLDFDDRLMSYATALLAGDLGRQLDLIEGWPETPPRKLAVLHQFMAFIYLTGVRRLDRDDPLMRTLSDQVRKLLVDGFAEISDRLRLDPETLWQDVLAVLDPREHLTASQLAMILSRLDRLIRKPVVAGLDQGHEDKISSPQRARRLRVHADPSVALHGQGFGDGKPVPADAKRDASRNGAHVPPESESDMLTERGRAANPETSRFRARVTSGPSKTYLSWPQVKEIWEIGSFLPQQFGLLFNLRLTVNHRTLGIFDHRAGARLVSDLTDELGGRIEYWEPGSPYHWVYRHEADSAGNLVSRVLLSIPDYLLDPAIDWLGRFAVRRTKFHDAAIPTGLTGRANERQSVLSGPERGTAVSDRAFLVSSRHAGSEAARIRFHWQGIRALSRCLAPDLVERDEAGLRRPLVDLLQIPRRWRGAVGDVGSAQGRGASKQLTHHARKIVANSEMDLLSALQERKWSELDQGWELRENFARLAERTRRENAMAQVHLRFEGSDELSTARREEELRALRSAFNPDPKSWLRKWSGWWLPQGRKMKASSARK
ncbi:DNA polymerase III subunit [Bradyrhizobium sp.]|uniref:DNA polymerase III subunit n=1 Tax=Bradyrhizobium sp. TaxID=376 RepID=UPI00403792CB